MILSIECHEFPGSSRTPLLQKNYSVLFERYPLVRGSVTFIDVACCQEIVSLLERCPLSIISFK